MGSAGWERSLTGSLMGEAAIVRGSHSDTDQPLSCFILHLPPHLLLTSVSVPECMSSEPLARPSLSHTSEVNSGTAPRPLAAPAMSISTQEPNLVTWRHMALALTCPGSEGFLGTVVLMHLEAPEEVGAVLIEWSAGQEAFKHLGQCCSRLHPQGLWP